MLRRRVAGSEIATVNIVESLGQHTRGESVKPAGRADGQDGRDGQVKGGRRDNGGLRAGDLRFSSRANPSIMFAGIEYAARRI
jgi:hypothetical protein